MGHAFTPGLKVTERTRVRKRRELPVAGTLAVKIGDHVRGADTVARAFLPGELHILRLGEKLGIEPFEVMAGLRVREGDTVERGTLLCEHAGLFGLFRSRYHAPVAGTVEIVTPQTGHIAVRSAATPIELTAYLAGEVVEMEEGKSVTIESTGAMVQGIFGVGGERLGRIMMLEVAPGQSPTEKDLPENCEGAILVGGARPSAEVLLAAGARGAVGMVVGSIDDRALARYLGYDLGIALTGDEEVPVTVMITEGFGEIPLSDRTLHLFRKFEGKEACMNGATQVRAGALRPEVIICHSNAAAGQSVEREEGLVVGRTVRLIRVPYFGKLAEIVELPHHAESIATGASTRVLRARLEDGTLVTVPRANVEIVEL